MSAGKWEAVYYGSHYKVENDKRTFVRNGRVNFDEDSAAALADLLNRLAAVEAERDKLKADEKQGIADYLALVDKDDAKYVEIQKLKAERDAEAKACDEARRMMATPGNRSCPLCSATIPRDHDHRLATVQTAREWTAAHDARRAARGKDGDGK